MNNDQDPLFSLRIEDEEHWSEESIEQFIEELQTACDATET